MLVYAVLKLLRIEVVMLASCQTADERDSVIDQFNHTPDKAKVLILTYAVGSVGLNLHHSCWRIHCVECPHNDGVAMQTLGRCRRLGNPSPDNIVYFYRYYVSKTWDDDVMHRNIQKMIPEAMASLNVSIFNGEDESEGGMMDLGDWVYEGGELIKFSESSQEGHILSPDELLHVILKTAWGEQTEL